MALTLDQEAALLALLDEKRITLPELTATTEVKADDLLLTNQLLADKSVTAKVLKNYIAPPATLDKQGVVQLSNDINSVRENIVATPKAIRDAVNERVPNIRRVNNKPLSSDIDITSQNIFSDQAIPIGANQDLNNYKTAGIYFQVVNENAANGDNYPEKLAGVLTVYRTAGTIQVYYVYNSSRVYTRALLHGTSNWTPWAKEFNTQNPPTAGNVGAYTKAESDARYNLKNTASKAVSGWWKCGTTGLIIQWGTLFSLAEGSTFNFPIAFPNRCTSIVGSECANTNAFTGMNFSSLTRTSVKVRGWNYNNAAIRMSMSWVAMGY